MSVTGLLGTNKSMLANIDLASKPSNIISDTITLATTANLIVAVVANDNLSFTLSTAAALSPDHVTTADGTINLIVNTAQLNSVIANEFPSLSLTSTGVVNRSVFQGFFPNINLVLVTGFNTLINAIENPNLIIIGNAGVNQAITGVFFLSFNITNTVHFDIDIQHILFVNFNLQSISDFLFFKTFDFVTLFTTSGFSAQATTSISKSLIINTITNFITDTQLNSNITFSINSITNFDGIDGPSEVVFLQGHANLAVNLLVTNDTVLELVTNNTFQIKPQLSVNPVIVIQGFPHINNVVFTYVIGGITLVSGSASVSVSGSPAYFPVIGINSQTGIPVDCEADFITSLSVNSLGNFIESIINPFSNSITFSSTTNLSISGFVAHFNNLVIPTVSNLTIATAGSVVDGNLILSVFQGFTGTLTGIYNITFKPGPNTDSATNLFFLNLGDFKLRPPIFGNEDKLEISRINRKTRNGTLRIFRQSYWPITQTFHWEIEGLKETDAKKAISIFEASLGQEIIITDFEGRKIKGLILTPLADIIQHGPNDDFHITLDFEGQFIA